MNKENNVLKIGTKVRLYENEWIETTVAEIQYKTKGSKPKHVRVIVEPA